MKEAKTNALAKIMTARETERIATVTMKIDGPMLGLFTLFGRGVAVDVDAGCPIHTLVCERLGIPEDYLASGIQTVFLDGWAVDDVDTAVVAPGAVVALSAAMPGLVGATMRRGGHYAVLRGNITHDDTVDSASTTVFGVVLIKLFNQVARDLGMHFLRRGAWVEGDRFLELAAAQPSGRILSITVDGAPTAVESLRGLNWTDRAVRLVVDT